MAKGLWGSIPDKHVGPLLAYFEAARERGVRPEHVSTDELLALLTRAALGG